MKKRKQNYIKKLIFTELFNVKKIIIKFEIITGFIITEKLF